MTWWRRNEMTGKSCEPASGSVALLLRVLYVDMHKLLKWSPKPRLFHCKSNHMWLTVCLTMPWKSQCSIPVPSILVYPGLSSQMTAVWQRGGAAPHRLHPNHLVKQEPPAGKYRSQRWAFLRLLKDVEDINTFFAFSNSTRHRKGMHLTPLSYKAVPKLIFIFLSVHFSICFLVSCNTLQTQGTC